MYKYNLMSIGIKILSIIIFVSMTALNSVLIVFHNQVPLIAILFSCLVTLLLLFACILFFNNKIIINLKTRKVIAISFKKHTINIDEIKNIAVNNNPSIDSEKYCNIEISLSDGSIIRVSGYSSMLKKGDVQKTRDIVGRLNTLLEESN